MKLQLFVKINKYRERKNYFTFVHIVKKKTERENRKNCYIQHCKSKCFRFIDTKVDESSEINLNQCKALSMLYFSSQLSISSKLSKCLSENI